MSKPQKLSAVGVSNRSRDEPGCEQRNHHGVLVNRLHNTPCYELGSPVAEPRTLAPTA